MFFGSNYDKNPDWDELISIFPMAKQGKLLINFSFDDMVMKCDEFIPFTNKGIFITASYSVFSHGGINFYRFFSKNGSDILQIGIKNGVIEDGLYFKYNEKLSGSRELHFNTPEFMKVYNLMKQHNIHFGGSELERDIETDNLEEITPIYIHDQIKEFSSKLNPEKLDEAQTYFMIFHYLAFDDPTMLTIALEDLNMSNDYTLTVYNTYLIKEIN